jgi:hypothetical protein
MCLFKRLCGCRIWGKCGFNDKTGKEVAPFIYEDVHSSIEMIHFYMTESQPSKRMGNGAGYVLSLIEVPCTASEHSPTLRT